MRDRLPYRLRGRRHWVEMLGVQRAEVNVCGIPFARSASRSSEWGESRRIGRGSRADAVTMRKTFGFSHPSVPYSSSSRPQNTHREA